MELSQKKVSERIDAVMQKLSLNQKQLAEKLETTQPAVSMYLSNRIPPAHILLKLAQLSGRSIEWFLTGDIDTMINRVSEPKSSYNQRLKLEKKISLLPTEIYNRIESLVDSILNTLKN
jgi:transcriptional regulator with XRE-family HTH domain